MSFIPKPDIGNVGRGALDTLSGFRSFILRGNVVDLAIGIVIGAAFTGIVTSFVSDVITPLIPVYHGNLATAAWTVPWTGLPLHYGVFINAIIAFVIVAAVLYFFVVRPVAAFMDRYKPEKVVAVTTRTCPYCLQTVPLGATVCAYCTSQLPPVQPSEGSTEVTTNP